MEKKLEEIKAENSEEAAEYLGFIKESVEDGTYFKDALNWYFFRYVTPICDRTLLIFGAMIAAVVLYFLYQMIQSAFPLVEKVPVIIEAKDQTTYFPLITELKPKKGKPGYDQGITTSDEAILKFLISTYVDDRESFDFSKGETEDVSIKFNRIKNLSSPEEYRNFQLIISPDNPNSPINNFGQNVKKTVQIESVTFLRPEVKNFTDQARQFLTNKIPTDAEVRFSATQKTISDNGTEEDRTRYLAKINFKFDGVNKEQKGVLKFTVNSYKLYKIK